jgi:hypothetical protein
MKIVIAFVISFVTLAAQTQVPWLNIRAADRRGTVHASQVSTGTAQTRPLSPSLGDMYFVNNGASTSDCTAGGGTNHNVCIWNGSSWQTMGGGGPATAIQTYTVGTLPSGTVGAIAEVTDGASASDCSTGGSSTDVICAYLGGSWTALGTASVTLYYQTVQITGSSETQRAKLNFLSGTGISVTAADNSGNGSTDVTVALPGGSGGLNSGALFTPVNTFNTTNTNYQNNSILTKIPGTALYQYPTSWKIRMVFLAGSPVIGNMVILRTLTSSTTVIDSTAVKIGGTSSPTLSSPGLVDTDAISLALDKTHDYWFVIYFTNTGANASVESPSGGPNILQNGYIIGDSTGDTTIPSLGTTGAPFLVVGGVLP